VFPDAQPNSDAGTNTHPDATVLDAAPGVDATTGNPDAASNPDAAPVSYTTLTVANAVAMVGTTKNVEIDNAVVVAENCYQSGGQTVGTFYLQDASPAGPGLSVYRSSSDATPYPGSCNPSGSLVGAVVTVQGYLGTFDGSIQISGKKAKGTNPAVPLVITVVNMTGGTVAGGAESPAGNPITAGTMSEYAHTLAPSAAHPEQVGNLIKFSGPLSITSSTTDPGPIETNSDGGIKPLGFSINGVWVDDDNVYTNCIKPKLDGGTIMNTITFPNGIQGMWDRYSDYYSSQNPPTVPVLVPMNCNDLTP
jgi:hypothetical protein